MLDRSPSGAVDVPGLELGLGAVLRRRACGHGEADVPPSLAGVLGHHGLAFQTHRIVDVLHAYVVARRPARLLHPVAECEGALRLAGHLHPNQHLQRGRRAQRGQLLHGDIHGGDFLLVTGDAAVDVGPAFVDGLEAGAVERRGLHQTLQINPRVFDGEILILKQQLFFSVKQGAACLGFLDVPMQAVAQGLKPLAFLRRFRPAQGVGVVPVRNVQHREPTLAGQPDAGRVDAGVQPAKHEHVDAFVQRHLSDPFNLGALLVNHHVVDAARHRDFA